MAKVCFARVDRIGDLILTLPCEKVWPSGDSVVWLVAENLKFVMEHVNPKPKVLYVPIPGKNFFSRWSAGCDLARTLKEQSFDQAVVFHGPWWVAFAFWLAGVKIRVGVASQWFSWLFFNFRLRQKRSRSVKHESQYNLELVEFALGKQNLGPLQPVELKPSAALVSRWSEVLKERGVDLDRLVIIHPGMLGSARNWPPLYYRELAVQCLEKKMSVVVTGSAADKEFIQSTEILEVPGIVSVVEETSGADLIALLSLSKVVVAPSTGTAHLAASLGVSVAGIYSPVRVQAPLRWEPLGKAVKVFVPQVSCPGILNCLGPACAQYDCMEKITVESIGAYVMDKL